MELITHRCFNAAYNLLWYQSPEFVFCLNFVISQLSIIVVYWCCMYKGSEKMVDHLMLHCKVTNALWNTIFGLFGLVWFMPYRVVDLLACWKDRFDSSEWAALWKLIPSCIMWCTCSQMNDQTFVDCEEMVVEVKDVFFRSFHFETSA